MYSKFFQTAYIGFHALFDWFQPRYATVHSNDIFDVLLISLPAAPVQCNVATDGTQVTQTNAASYSVDVTIPIDTTSIVDSGQSVLCGVTTDTAVAASWTGANGASTNAMARFWVHASVHPSVTHLAKLGSSA
jgi:hypothetical protein